jgi:hypothetical protein
MGSFAGDPLPARPAGHGPGQLRTPAARWLLQCLQELSGAMGCHDVLWAEVPRAGRGRAGPRSWDVMAYGAYGSTR